MISFCLLLPGVNWTLRPKHGGMRGVQAIHKKKGSLVIIMNPFDVLCPFFLLLARLFADVLNDIAMFMEILAPHFPAFFTLIVCTAGIFKVNKN